MSLQTGNVLGDSRSSAVSALEAWERSTGREAPGPHGAPPGLQIIPFTNPGAPNGRLAVAVRIGKMFVPTLDGSVEPRELPGLTPLRDRAVQWTADSRSLYVRNPAKTPAGDRALRSRNGKPSSMEDDSGGRISATGPHADHAGWPVLCVRRPERPLGALPRRRPALRHGKRRRRPARSRPPQPAEIGAQRR
jgi:hypothetical protein